jgi:Schlafen, AlbA_2
MTDEEIQRRLLDVEDGWTERKPPNVDRDLVRKALVAFANSVPDGEEAILFIGVADDGTPIGVDNPEKTQKTVRQWADWCYPPIRHSSRVVEFEGKHVVAVIVQPDHDRPHFAGPAYVRVGSESTRASESVFEELIASRISKARALLEAMRKGELVCVREWPYGFRNEGVAGLPEECTVVECTPLLAVFQTTRGGKISGDYERMRFGRTSNGKQLTVDVEG